MATGVKTSAHVILFLSANVLQRPFVIFEIETALAANKKIILIHEQEN